MKESDFVGCPSVAGKELIEKTPRPCLDNNELFSKLYFYETPASRIWNDGDSHGDRHPEQPPDGRKFLK
jgi:hypothetical protein